MRNEQGVGAKLGKAKPEPIHPAPAGILVCQVSTTTLCYIGRILGVRKNSNSCDVELTVVCLNRFPSTGTLPTSGHLSDGGLLLGDDNSADHHGGPVGDRDLGFRRLRIDSRNALHARNGLVDLVVLTVTSI